jgi:hypothetical protein
MPKKLMPNPSRKKIPLDWQERISRKEREQGRAPAFVCGESMGQPPDIILGRKPFAGH